MKNYSARYRLFILSIAILTSANAYGLETGQLKVMRIIDGDSIVVEGSAGGVSVPISVRLQYIDTPEMRNGNSKNPLGRLAKDTLKEILKTTSTVILHTDRKKFSADPHGRVLAIVWLVHLDDNGLKHRQCLQEYMIARGMSVYWQRYGTAGAQFHKQWQTVENSAQTHGNGLWLRQREWMLSKRAEGTKR